MSTVTTRGEPEDIPVLSARADRDEEFALFMATATPALARTAWLLCGDEHRAEELVQRALMNTYLAWPGRVSGTRWRTRVAPWPTCGSTRGASTAARC